MKKIAAAITAGMLVLAPAAAVSATTAPISTATVVAKGGYVKYPKAVPGRYCRAAWVGKKAKTVRYGTLTCKKKGSRARWSR